MCRPLLGEAGRGWCYSTRPGIAPTTQPGGGGLLPLPSHSAATCAALAPAAPGCGPSHGLLPALRELPASCRPRVAADRGRLRRVQHVSRLLAAGRDDRATPGRVADGGKSMVFAW